LLALLLAGCAARAPWPSLAAPPDLAGAQLTRGGRVVAEVDVDLEGAVGAVRLIEMDASVQTLGPRIEQAARRWRFAPAASRTTRLVFDVIVLPEGEADSLPRFLPPDHMEVRVRGR
jgi:hypothetical protein